LRSRSPTNVSSAVISENDAGIKPTSSIANGTSKTIVFGSPTKSIAKPAPAISSCGRMKERMNIGARMRQSLMVSATSRRAMVRTAFMLIG
jgi:hypothetical protein